MLLSSTLTFPLKCRFIYSIFNSTPISNKCLMFILCELKSCFCPTNHPSHSFLHFSKSLSNSSQKLHTHPWPLSLSYSASTHIQSVPHSDSQHIMLPTVSQPNHPPHPKYYSTSSPTFGSIWFPSVCSLQTLKTEPFKVYVLLLLKTHQ